MRITHYYDLNGELQVSIQRKGRVNVLVTKNRKGFYEVWRSDSLKTYVVTSSRRQAMLAGINVQARS